MDLVPLACEDEDTCAYSLYAHFKNTIQGTKIFQYYTCTAGRVTYNFHSSCKHMYLSFKSIYNKEHMGLIYNKTDKVPYITVRIIFTRIPYADKKISQSIL